MSTTIDRLDREKLRAALGDALIGCHIVVLEETTSTNDTVLQFANENAPEGLVVLAEHQTAGRGQRGNRWESAARRGLWFSILLRPKIDISESARLTSWAAKCIADTIQKQFSLAAKVKWPNDVQVNARKIAGVLAEMRAQKDAPHIAVLGIGVNVNHALQDFSEELRPSAISLAIALDRQVSREDLAIALLRELDRTYVTLFGR